jgi:hypothetical protein
MECLILNVQFFVLIDMHERVCKPLSYIKEKNSMKVNVQMWHSNQFFFKISIKSLTANKRWEEISDGFLLSVDFILFR